jgi:Mn2+/Fe2+ NRAMP family transporter
MPWMIFYQQSAVADKKLRPEHYKDARWDTALGAVMTQLVMPAVLVATAATIGKSDSAASLNTVGDISNALTPFMGPAVGRLVFSLGIIGAAMVAAIVVSLASAWGFGVGLRRGASAWGFGVGLRRGASARLPATGARSSTIPWKRPGSMPSTRPLSSGAPSWSLSYRTS